LQKVRLGGKNKGLVAKSFQIGLNKGFGLKERSFGEKEGLW